MSDINIKQLNVRIFKYSFATFIASWFSHVFKQSNVVCVDLLCSESKHETSEVDALIVTSTETIDKEILHMYFEQFSENCEIQKNGETQWIVTFANLSGKTIYLHYLHLLLIIIIIIIINK